MLALLLTLGACTSLVRETARSASAAPFSLAPNEQRIRTALATSQFQSALGMLASEKEGAPSDRLLRELYAGTASFYAGKLAESADAFARAASLADDRYTKSVTRNALALGTNDLALPYAPGHNERLLVHYYALLAWLGRGDVSGAAVEARRLGALMQEYDDDRRSSLDAPTRAMLRYLSGSVLLAAGDTNDAAVAFRNASALAGDSLPGAWRSDSQPRVARRTRRASVARVDSGDVLVVIEQGFVTHRVEQRLTVHGAHGTSQLSRAADRLGGDAALWADGTGTELDLSSDEDDSTVADSAERARWRKPLRIAWPAFRRPAPLASVALVVDSGASAPLVRADLSAAEAGDFARDRGARLTRLLLRAATRATAASQLERKHSDLASIVRTVGSAVERADVRSWHLLPGAVSVARVRLPVGEHAIAADVGGERVSLGTVCVTASGLALASTRIWGPSLK